MNPLSALVDLVLPAVCVSCRRPDTGHWCRQCRPDPAPQLCEAKLGVPVWAAGDYAGGLRTALLAYKERGLKRLGAPLSEYMRAAVLPLAEAVGTLGQCRLVPVPSTRPAARERGGDHVLRLVRPLADIGSIVTALHAGGVTDSAHLTGAQRRLGANRMSARSPGPLESSKVVLVDDILTTGSTLAHCIDALSMAGWQVQGAAVIARTVLRSTGPVGRPQISRSPTQHAPAKLSRSSREIRLGIGGPTGLALP